MKILNRWVHFLYLSVFASGILASPLTEPPMTSSEYWLIAEEGKVLFARNADAPVQIASLTKLMTAIVALDLLKGDEAWRDQRVTVSNLAAILPGTSARLETGDRLTMDALMHGMLLPSGNDAAMALAESVGRTLKAEGLDYKSRFIKAMNTRAQELGMTSTHFVDVHGMGNNVSTAADLLLLVQPVLQDQYLRQVVGTTFYQAEIRSNRGRVRTPVWQNTNELLGEFFGVKTGHTNIAGGCLVLAGAHSGKDRVVIVLNSDNQRLRFMDAYNLYQWSFLVSDALTD